MNALYALLIGGSVGALLWFFAYEAIIMDFRPSNPFFYKNLVKMAFSASAGIAAASLSLLVTMSGVSRRKFKPVKDDQGKILYNPNRVLKLGPRTWNEDEFCGHMLITGASGFGKTVAYKAMLDSLLQNVPNLGGMVIDAKGDILPDLEKLMRIYGRENDLIVVQARNPATFPDWTPPHRLNLIGDETIPYTVRAKLLADAMAALNSGSDSPFFKQQGPDWFAKGMELLDELEEPVTIATVAELFSDPHLMEHKVGVLESLAESRARTELISSLRGGLIDLQSEGQKEGILGSVRNLVSKFLTPGIREVFASSEPDTFKISGMDEGKIIVLSISQEFTGERKAVYMLMKLAAYRHGKRRFDHPEEIKNKNMICLFFDEFQNYVTSSSDGETDFSAIDQLRSAKMPIIAGSQSTTSLIPAFGSRERAQTFMLNCTNLIIFRSADESCSKLSADALGKKEKWKKSYSSGSGKASVSKTKQEEHNVKPHVLRALPKLTCYLNHVSLGVSKLKMPIPKSLFEKR